MQEGKKSRIIKTIGALVIFATLISGLADFGQIVNWFSLKPKNQHLQEKDTLLHPKFENPMLSFADPSENRELISKESLFGYQDRKGNVVIHPQYDFARDFSENKAIVRKGNQLLLIDTLGKILLELNYDDAESFFEDRALVYKNKKCGFIDPSGKLVIPLKYEDGSGFNNGRAMVSKNRKVGYVDIYGNVKTPLIYDGSLGFMEGKAAVYKDNKVGFINLDGELIWTLSLLGRSANKDIPKIPDVMNIIINKGIFGGG
ncbi:WG repeat-containing protein [Haliscomenobacter hydrossis]|uniref:KWG Leptospira repeat protein n=1 Tax=Haliscomenobacter hydrossis (strain ATCC 27775 / DSM 1100 / LMG 10767 / O) TaxID=760192 RepID=F4KR66_HALH1|nr:WG repeat-containing protein [Haliscomenobacter hydrossis]AEE54253.1 KWG Leptospira repeat protein [Haliscomenobacter hydrossis DSM 1100]